MKGQLAMAAVEAVFFEKTGVSRDERAVLAKHWVSASRIAYTSVVREARQDRPNGSSACPDGQCR